MTHYICVRFMVAVSNLVLVNVVNTVKNLSLSLSPSFSLFKLASFRQVQQSEYVKQNRLSVTKLRGGWPDIASLIPLGDRNSFLHLRFQQVTGAHRASFRIETGISAGLKWQEQDADITTV
jgi:hypothetical protein